jgi:hypothetical protein
MHLITVQDNEENGYQVRTFTTDDVAQYRIAPGIKVIRAIEEHPFQEGTQEQLPQCYYCGQAYEHVIHGNEATPTAEEQLAAVKKILQAELREPTQRHGVARRQLARDLAKAILLPKEA